MSYRSVFKPDLFAGQTVIVTGGGSGIGRCTAHEIAALGAHVVITGRKAEKLAAVKARDRDGRRLVRDARLRHPRGSAGQGGGREDRRQQRPHPRPVQQRRRPVPGDGRRHERQGLRRGGAQQPHRRLHRQPRGLHAVDGEPRRLDREHGRRHEERLPEHGAHRRRARRHGQPHHDARPRMGLRRRAGERGVAGLDRLVRHGHLPGRVQGAHSQAQELLPARPARHRERGVGGGLLPAERRLGLHHRHRDPHRRRRAARQPLDGSARSPTSRSPSTASISP